MALAGASIAAAAAAHGEQAAMPVIGFMSARSPDDSAYLLAAFRDGLAAGGFVEGRNVAVEYRWARGDYSQLPVFAAELVRLPVAVLVGVGGDASALAAKAATSTIPVIFGMGSDPVAAGMVASLNRPGGNVTGVNVLTVDIEAKRLGLLNQVVPGDGTIGALVNPSYPPAAQQIDEIQTAARKIGRPLLLLRAGTDQEIEAAFDMVGKRRAVALLVGVDPFFDTRRERIVALAAQRRVPAVYQFREYALAGGLMSYGVNLADAYRQFGIYAAKVLKGVRPDDLPVMQSVSFEFVVNLKTARALGLAMPQSILAGVTEVIE